MCELMDTFKSRMDEDNANNMSFIVFNMSLMVGEAIGPAFGGYVTQEFDFTRSCVYASMINFAYAAIYFIYTYSEIFRDFKTKKADGLRSQFFIEGIHTPRELPKGRYFNYSSRGSINIV
jgi:MFS-type transporter involved in bile tolerance (Atg22 family)